MKKLLFSLILAPVLFAQSGVWRDGPTSASGSGTTYTASYAVSPTLISNHCYSFKADVANTGAATINFNSLGAKAIVKFAGGVNTALVANDIRAGQIVFMCYDGTSMQMQSTLGNTSGGGGGSSGTISSGGLTGNITNTGSSVVIYSATLPAIATGGCVQISGQLTVPAVSTEVDVFVDATLVATPFSTLNNQVMSFSGIYCNTTAQTNQQFSYLAPILFNAAGSVPLTATGSNIDGSYKVSAINTAVTHTISINTTAASGNTVGTFWRLSQ